MMKRQFPLALPGLLGLLATVPSARPNARTAPPDGAVQPYTLPPAPASQRPIQ